MAAEAQLAIVTAHKDGRLAGIAPLFHTPDYDGRPCLMLLGGIEISDYLDLIARPGDLDEFVCWPADLFAHRRSTCLGCPGTLQPAGFLAQPARPGAGGRKQWLELPGAAIAALALYPAARRLGNLPGRHRQEAAPRNPAQDAPGRGNASTSPAGTSCTNRPAWMARSKLS